MTYLRINLR